MGRLLRQMGEHWAARSAGSGLVSTAVDVAVLLGCVHLLHLGAVAASAAGVLTGSLVSFALNKYVAFRDPGSPLLPQLGKYAATVALTTAAHASLMGLLVEHLHAPLLPAKLVADLLVFTCGNLWLMRLVVFRLGPRPAPPLDG